MDNNSDNKNNIAPKDIFDIAKQLAARVNWEEEMGVSGYPAAQLTNLPQAESRVMPQDKPQPIQQSESRFISQEKSRTMPQAKPQPIPQPIPQNDHELSLDTIKSLADLKHALRDCKRCELYKNRTKIVFGDGNLNAKLVFVGEGPGHEEDISGIPFVGAAGQLLNKIIEAMRQRREDIYICNIVKCRPPENRDPHPDETNICGNFLHRQLEIINPQIIVTLGRPASQYLLKTTLPMGKLRGNFYDFGKIKVMPTYHPAYLLRNASAKRPVWEDMKKVRDLLISFKETK